MFRKAEKRQAKLRLALCGPSGSGKTYSALLIAQGLAPSGLIALIDTERGSGELYADLTAYDVAPLEPPYTPQRYIEIIHAAESAGYDVLIIDSLSHAWTGEGGVLDMHDRAVSASRSGNSFMAWREVTPQHNSLVDAIIGAKLHVIVTMRSKTAYDLTDDGTGKKKPIKIGLSPVQRDGMEYEFTTVVDLSVDKHIATATKDRTGLFDGVHFLPTPATGEALRTWLLSGKEPVSESKRILEILKGSASLVDTVPSLETWWRARSAEIALLTPPDRESLISHCASRKLAVIEATARTAPDEEETQTPKRRGNGDDRTASAAGIDALKAATR